MEKQLSALEKYEQAHPAESTPLTARTLRQALFFLADQKMTAEQIRAMLYTVEDQDAPIDPGFSMWLKMENKAQKVTA